MIKKKKIILILLPSLLLGIVAQSFIYGDLKEQIDLKSLTSSGEDWNMVTTVNERGGQDLFLFTDKWLMYFLHWRPLTQENKNISEEYVKKVLLSFWGPGMPFKIKGNGGQMIINGHQGYFVDGILPGSKINTRFIIWNCTETNRQFIADCNINRKLKTPVELLNLQFKITSTISCHGNSKNFNIPELKKKYQSDDFNISFYIPKIWNTNIFTYKKWFPNGATKSNGTLWTLITDSNKMIYLKHLPDLKEYSEENIKTEILKLIGRKIPAGLVNEKAKIKNIQLKEAKKQGEYLMVSGDMVTEYKYQGKGILCSYLIKGFLWQGGDKAFLLIAGMEAIKEVWGRLFNLSPGMETLDNYILNEVLPVVRIFPVER